MNPLLTRCFALLLVVVAIVMGRSVLVAGDEEKRVPFGSRSLSPGGNLNTPDRHPSKSRKSATERSRTSGSMHGFDANVRYTDVPDLTVKWTNLPPGARGHVRIYRGAPSSEPFDVQILAGSQVVNNDRMPRNRRLDLQGLNDQFKKDGPHTIELVRASGPGTTILDQFYPLLVDRTLTPRALFFTAE